MDLGIGNAPPERITHYAVSCYDLKLTRLTLTTQSGIGSLQSNMLVFVI